MATRLITHDTVTGNPRVSVLDLISTVGAKSTLDLKGTKLLEIVEDYGSTSTVEEILRLTRTTTGVAANGIGSRLNLFVENGDGVTSIAHIDAKVDDVTATSVDSSLIFRLSNNSVVADRAILSPSTFRYITTDLGAGEVSLGKTSKFNDGIFSFNTEQVSVEVSPIVNSVNIATPSLRGIRSNPIWNYSVTLSMGLAITAGIATSPKIVSSGLGAGSDTINLAGFFTRPTFDGTVGLRTCNLVRGIITQPEIVGGTVTNMRSVEAQAVVTAGTVTDLRMFHATAPTNTGTITTLTLLHLDDAVGGTTNIAIRQQGITGHNRLQARTSIGRDAEPEAGVALEVTRDGTPLSSPSATVKFVRSSVAASECLVQLQSGNTSNAQINFGDTDSAFRGRIGYQHIGTNTNEYVHIWAGATEIVRITQNKQIIPPNNGEGSVGTAANRWNQIYANEVNPGDIRMLNDMRITEIGEDLGIKNQKGDLICIITKEGDMKIKGKVLQDAI